MKFDVLSPSEAQVSRMQVRVVEGYENRPKSLWREWWGMLQARPVKNGVLVAMAAALVLFGSPVLELLNAAAKRAQVAKTAVEPLQRGYASFVDFDDGQASSSAAPPHVSMTEKSNGGIEALERGVVALVGARGL